MNQAQQPASGQVIRQQNLSQETSFQLDKTLCELQRSLIEFTSPIKEDQNETPRRFNSECPGKVEYEIIRGILKQQKQLLQQECNEGKDTSQRKLVLDLLRSNWRYLLFKSKSEEKEQLNTVRCSRFHQRDTRDFQEQNDNLDRDIAFKQHLGMLISYLTDLTAGWRINDPQTKRLIEEINSGEVNSEL